STPHGAADQVASVESSAETVVTAPISKSKRGRPSKSDQELWTTSSTEALFIDNVRNHVEVGAAWILVATLVNKDEDTAYTVTQYKDKWSMYRKDRSNTANVPKTAAPPCLELMLEHWGEILACRVHGTSDLDDDDKDNASTSRDTGRSSPNKHQKIQLIMRLRALADGVKVVGEAMKTQKASAGNASVLSQEVVTPLALSRPTFYSNECSRPQSSSKVA
ncbi:hypothetical protein GN958_ATG17241, partial [Phytophthora infestans]